MLRKCRDMNFVSGEIPVAVYTNIEKAPRGAFSMLVKTSLR
jgi:hypothetical protein